MFAALVGVDGLFEGNVGRLVAGDDPARLHGAAFGDPAGAIMFLVVLAGEG
jgi:hypothetical protein